MQLIDNASHISTLIFFSPILSLVWIHFIAGEPIYFSTIIALALILFGLILLQKKNIGL